MEIIYLFLYLTNFLAWNRHRTRGSSRNGVDGKNIQSRPRSAQNRTVLKRYTVRVSKIYK